MFRPFAQKTETSPGINRWQSELVPVPGDPCAPVRLHVAEAAEGLAGDAPKRLIVLWPGLGETPEALAPLAGRLVQAGQARGERPIVVSYTMLLTGHNSYSHDHKTARGIAAVRKAAELFGLPADSIAHSEGWGCAVDAAPLLLEGGSLRSVLGVAPAYHAAQSGRKLAVVSASVRMLQEAVRPRHIDAHGRRARQAMRANTAEHLAHNVSALWHESDAILSSDRTAEAVRLSQDPRLAVGVIACVGDEIACGRKTDRNLWEAGFKGPIDMIKTDHGGPLFEPEWAPVMYDRLMQMSPLQQ